MTPEPYRTEPITISEAKTSSLGSARMVRRLEEPGQRPQLLVARTTAPLRRSTYQAPLAQRVLLLSATLALAATGTLQAIAVATYL